MVVCIGSRYMILPCSSGPASACPHRRALRRSCAGARAPRLGARRAPAPHRQLPGPLRRGARGRTLASGHAVHLRDLALTRAPAARPLPRPRAARAHQPLAGRRDDRPPLCPLPLGRRARLVEPRGRAGPACARPGPRRGHERGDRTRWAARAERGGQARPRCPRRAERGGRRAGGGGRFVRVAARLVGRLPRAPPLRALRGPLRRAHHRAAGRPTPMRARSSVKRSRRRCMAWPAPPISRRSRDPRPLLDGADAGARALRAGGGASPPVPPRAPRAPPPAAGPHRRRATTRAPLLDTRGVGRGGDDGRPPRRGPPAAVAGPHRGADHGDAHGRAHRGRPAGRRRHAPVLSPGPARPGAARARRGAAPLLHRHGDRAVAQLPAAPSRAGASPA